MFHHRSSTPSDETITTTLTQAPVSSRASGSSGEASDHYRQPESQRGSVLYLAYGSNLSKETFRGNRGIKPLAQINVQVPSLRLTFDLPGIPYLEPCFANSGTRDPENDPPVQYDLTSTLDEKVWQTGVGLQKHEKYHKDQWHKGLVGVVYEVTPEDYAHIIATEGGGSSYKDILVDCHPFVSKDPKAPVPQNPTLPPFKAHTLFAPALPPGSPPPKNGGRFQRPDPSYAQASARYLKLLTDGAAELELPYEYQDFLLSLRPYTITTRKQKLGQGLFVSIWVPVISIMFMLSRMFADDNGRVPAWLAKVTLTVFQSLWISYDNVFKNSFGDGERTIAKDGDEGGAGSSVRPSGAALRPTQYDVEKAEPFRSEV